MSAPRQAPPRARACAACCASSEPPGRAGRLSFASAGQGLTAQLVGRIEQVSTAAVPEPGPVRGVKLVVQGGAALGAGERASVRASAHL